MKFEIKSRTHYRKSLFQKFVARDSQRLSNFLNGGKCWITFSTLNITHLSTIKAESTTNVALRHFLSLSYALYVFPKLY